MSVEILSESRKENNIDIRFRVQMKFILLNVTLMKAKIHVSCRVS